MTKSKSSILNKKFLWIFTTYFAEGFPFTIIRIIFPLFLRDMKVSLESIGLTSLYGVPWVLKFLWSPLVDEFGTKRKWIIYLEIFITISMFITALFIPFNFGIKAIGILFLIVAFISATHDIAIDGFYMEALDENDQALFVGYRAIFYRIAMWVATSLIATIGTVYGWIEAFLVTGFVMGLFLTYNYFLLPKHEQNKKHFSLLFRSILKFKSIFISIFLFFIILIIRFFLNSNFCNNIFKSYPFLEKITFSHVVALMLLIFLILLYFLRNLITKKMKSNYSQVFTSYINREKIGLVLIFITTLRGGEWIISTMTGPFFVDLGIKTHYGWISGFIGLPLLMLGSVVGGWFLYKYNLRKLMLPFILLQNLTNIFYMLLAIKLNNFILSNSVAGTELSNIGNFNMFIITAVIGAENFASGLGTAVLMIFLMKLCKPEYKASHYAIGSGLMSLSGLFMGSLSGFIAGSMGYAWTFGISFVVSIPAMLVIPFLHNYEKESVL